MVQSLRSLIIILIFTTLVSGCGTSSDSPIASESPTASPTDQALPSSPTNSATPQLASGQPTGIRFTSNTNDGTVELEVTELARDLDTVWALAWDSQGQLWYTERSGRLTQLGQEPVAIEAVAERGEGGLMGLAIDSSDRKFLMYTAANENRVIRLEPDGTQTVLVDGIESATYHNGGRIILGTDNQLYVGTGDAGREDLPQQANSLNGKILRVNPDSGEVNQFSTGHRNAQGLCFAPNGQLFSTEHGTHIGDEINVIAEGSNGGWPQNVGNGIHNYTPTIAPGGCVIYNAALIPQWQNSMLFVAMRDQSLRRLWFTADGSVAGEEVLLQNEFGRLRDVAVGPDGAVYLATSNGDSYGSPRSEGDRILRLAPVQ